MNHTLTALTMAAVALAGTAAQAQAADYTATLVADGWIRSNGQSNGATPQNDYVAGNLRRSGEYRNFFTFDVPVYSGDITSATLSMPTESTSFSQSPGMIYQVTSTGSQSFGSLGTGTVYGSMTYDQASQPVVSIISFNDAGLAALRSGEELTLSGRIVSGASFGSTEPSQFVFGSTGAGDNPTLSFSTTGGGGGGPEPSTWALMMVGVFGAGAALRRRQGLALVAAA